MSRLITAMMLASVLTLGGCPRRSPSAAGEPSAPRGAAADPATPAPAAEPPMTAASKVARATSLLTTGLPEDATRARDLLRSVLEGSPDDTLARFDLGVALHRLGDLEGAFEAFSRVTRTDPSFAKAWLYLGQTEQQLGEVDSAIRRFRTAIATHPDDFELRLALVSALRAVGRLDEAIEEARSALRLNSRSLPIYAEMGRVWLAKGDLDMARFVFEKADSIPGSENNAAVQAGFGWVLHEQGERYGAEFRLKQALQVDPRLLEGQVWLARLYSEDHNWPAAVPLLESAVSAEPRRAGLRLDLGNALRGVGRFDDAMAEWKKARELDVSDPTPLFNLGVVLGDDLKRWDDAVPLLEQYIVAGGAESALAQTYVESFKKEKSRAELRRKSEEDRARRAKEREAEEKRRAEAAAEAARKEKEAPPPPAEPDPAGPWGPTDPGGQ